MILRPNDFFAFLGLFTFGGLRLESPHGGAIGAPGIRTPYGGSLCMPPGNTAVDPGAPVRAASGRPGFTFTPGVAGTMDVVWPDIITKM